MEKVLEETLAKRLKRAPRQSVPHRAKIRAELDPMFYTDIESFRAAVANGMVDESKGCRDMNEYHWSVSHG